MSARSSDLAAAQSLPVMAGSSLVSRPSTSEIEVITLFNEFHNRLCRYVMGFGLSCHDAEEIVQEVFLSLFRHLNLGRSRQNLRGWIFRVANNLALKRRHANKRALDRNLQLEINAPLKASPEPSPEEQVLSEQRRTHLLGAFKCLPEQDQCCLRLRAEGLRYREIAKVLGISLGSVATSLARSLTRLACADQR